MVAISDSDRYFEAVATGGQTVFQPDFPLLTAAELIVKRKRGAVVTPLSGANYGVSGLGDDDGFTVTLTSGATAGDLYQFWGETKLETTSEYAAGQKLDTGALNADMARALMRDQELRRDIDTTTDVVPVLPEPDDGKYLSWDGDLLINRAITALASLGLAGPFVDNAVIRYSGTTGEFVQGSVVSISDAGIVAGVSRLDFSGGHTLREDDDGLAANRLKLLALALGNDNPILFSDNALIKAKWISGDNVLALMNDTTQRIGFTLGASPAVILDGVNPKVQLNGTNPTVELNGGDHVVTLDTALGEVSIDGQAIVGIGARDTGWAASTGATQKGGIDSDATVFINTTYSQGQMENLRDLVVETRQVLHAVLVLLTTAHPLAGP